MRFENFQLKMRTLRMTRLESLLLRPPVSPISLFFFLSHSPHSLPTIHPAKFLGFDKLTSASPFLFTSQEFLLLSLPFLLPTRSSFFSLSLSCPCLCSHLTFSSLVLNLSTQYSTPSKPSFKGCSYAIHPEKLLFSSAPSFSLSTRNSFSICFFI